MEFKDRTDAGRRLAARLWDMPREDLVVLGLPRGGVPVAFEVASALGVPLDVIVVRKLGLPFQPELAMGAVGEGGVCVLNESVVQLAGVTEAEINEARDRELVEVAHRARRFRGAPRAGSARGSNRAHRRRRNRDGIDGARRVQRRARSRSAPHRCRDSSGTARDDRVAVRRRG